MVMMMNRCRCSQVLGGGRANGASVSYAEYLISPSSSFFSDFTSLSTAAWSLCNSPLVLSGSMVDGKVSAEMDEEIINGGLASSASGTVVGALLVCDFPWDISRREDINRGER